jgi:mitogen-activated protein kinase kinase
LAYLYATHHIIHRDINPSNILIDSLGNIKLYNFATSSKLLDSIANTVVGTIGYMSPERIQGTSYTTKGDTWAVGMTVLELATATYPYSGYESDGSLLDLLQDILFKPPPTLPDDDAFPTCLHELVTKCLMKDPDSRPSPMELNVCVFAIKRQNHKLTDFRRKTSSLPKPGAST